MARVQVERIAQYRCETGEGPMWHPEERRLYWVDIPGAKLFRYDPKRDHHEQVYHDRPIGGFTIQDDGSLLLFRDKGNVALWRNGEVVHTLIDEIPGEARSRFNDVAADPEGRVFCGTMPSHNKDTGEKSLGRLYRLDPDGSLRTVLEGIGCSNGIGWTNDLQRMFYIDTPTREVGLFDYNRATGEIANRRVFASVTEGYPDGMTVDANDGVWVALWGGYGVLHFDRSGNLVEKVELPAKNVTSVMFGGPELDELYITTATGGEKDANPEHDGALYRCRPGVTGKPEFRSRIRTPETRGTP